MNMYMNIVCTCFVFFALCGNTCCIVFISGVALAVILSGVRHISDTVFLEAAKVRSLRRLNISQSSSSLKLLKFLFTLPSSHPPLSCWLCYVCIRCVVSYKTSLTIWCLLFPLFLDSGLITNRWGAFKRLMLLNTFFHLCSSLCLPGCIWLDYIITGINHQRFLTSTLFIILFEENTVICMFACCNISSSSSLAISATT